MEASRFLSLGKQNFTLWANDGYMVHLGFDGSIAVFETTAMPDGYYNQDFEFEDDELISFYGNILEDKAATKDDRTVSELIESCLLITKIEDFKEVSNMPKMTKAVADGLSKVEEMMTLFLNGENGLEFMCFGTRPLVTSTIATIKANAITVSPINYYYATMFKGPTFAMAMLDYNTLIVTNAEKTMGAIVMGVDIVVSSQYRIEKQM